MPYIADSHENRVPAVLSEAKLHEISHAKSLASLSKLSGSWRDLASLSVATAKVPKCFVLCLFAWLKSC